MADTTRTQNRPPGPFSEALRWSPGQKLDEIDTRGRPEFGKKKAKGIKRREACNAELSELQEKFWAQSFAGGTRRILLVLQGMDTAGKGGILRDVIGAVDPQGVDLTAFKAPTKKELSKHFLWRIRRELPEPGHIGVFDRSHYEDVLIVRVHDLVPKKEWEPRYEEINEFEQELIDGDTTVIKVFLHISNDEQRDRIERRLSRKDRLWKFTPEDIDERAHWDDYQEAYQDAFDRCAIDGAPWHVVPADRRWYGRLAVQQILLEHLRAMDLAWPDVDVNVGAERARLAAS